MKKPNLLLLSGVYPFRGGEPFLDLEVQIISKYFNVFILPCGANNQQRVYNLPENVSVLELESQYVTNQKRSVISLIRYCLGSFPYLFQEGRNDLIHLLHPLGFIRAFWRAVRAQIIAPIISEISRTKGIQVIYSYWMSYEALAAVISRGKAGVDLLTITRAHGHDLYDYANTPRFCPFQRHIMENIDAVVTISQNGENYLASKYPGFKNKVHTFRLGVARGGKASFSTDGIFRIASCSSLKPLKRVHLIPEALRQVDFPVLWTHIGDGPEMSRVLRSVNETKKENPLFSANLIGYFKNEKVLEFYETNPVDLFISVSSSEGIPVSIMEAVSRGIPSVATNVGGTSELITPELGGSWLLPPKVFPEDIANLLTLIKRQEWHITERDKAFYLWENRFDATKNYSIFAKWLIGFQESKTIEGVVPE